MGKHSDQKGQAILEYVIVLGIILSFAGLIRFGLQKSRDRLWKVMICDISAPCPGCPAPESAKKLLPKAGSCAQ
ncbi:hypothetical protein EB061_09365 [bacterium]|nr:hypothetical protein [bacterium]